MIITILFFFGIYWVICLFIEICKWRSAYSKMSKEKQVILHLLELYKDMPYLWDKHHVNYRDRARRRAGYETLLPVYKQIEENPTVKSVVKKINNCRTNYIKEFRKVQASRQSRDEDIYVPKLWYYDSLSFLKHTIEPWNGEKDPLETEGFRSYLERDLFHNENSLSSADHNRQNSMSSDSTGSFKRKKQALLNGQHILERPGFMNSNEQDWEIHGKSIGLQLRDLDHKQDVIARKLISDVIFYANLNKLSEESFVGVRP